MGLVVRITANYTNEIAECRRMGSKRLNSKSYNSHYTSSPSVARYSTQNYQRLPLANDTGVSRIIAQSYFIDKYTVVMLLACKLIGREQSNHGNYCTSG